MARLKEDHCHKEEKETPSQEDGSEILQYRNLL
jgi:hypothetical protein